MPLRRAAAAGSIRLALLCPIFLFLLPRSSDAGILNSHYKGDRSWVYLDRFAFNVEREDEEKPGEIQATFEFPNGTEPVLMLYYMSASDDEWGKWEAVNDPANEFDCSTKYRIAKNSGYATPLLDLPENPEIPGGHGQSVKTRSDGDEQLMIKRSLSREFHTSRTRWFFITVGDCKERCVPGERCANSVDITFSINMTNGDGWDQYFSADLQDIPEATIFFMVMYLLLGLFSLYVRAALQRKRKYHHTVKLIVFAIWASFVSLLAYVICITNYANTGSNEGYTGVYVFAIIFQGCADQALVLNLILISKGWTIVRRKISGQGRMRLAIYMTIYAICYWFCQIFFAFGIDPSAVEYIYSTPPGIVVVLVRAMSFVWMTYAIHTTLRKYKAKKGFYKKLWFFGGLWMLSIPILVLLNLTFDEAYRDRVLTIVQLLMNFIFSALMIYMYHPTGIFSGTFPFHATTSEMLNAKMGSGHNRSGGAGGAGGSSFDNMHLRRAADISRRIRQGVTLLQSYSSDLNSFLEELDPATDELLNEGQDLAPATNRHPSSMNKQHAPAAMAPMATPSSAAGGSTSTWAGGAGGKAMSSVPRSPGDDDTEDDQMPARPKGSSSLVTQ